MLADERRKRTYNPYFLCDRMGKAGRLEEILRTIPLAVIRRILPPDRCCLMLRNRLCSRPALVSRGSSIVASLLPQGPFRVVAFRRHRRPPADYRSGWLPHATVFTTGAEKMNSRFFVQAANTAGCLADRQNWSVILVARAWLCILVLVVASLTAASGFGQPPSSSPAAARRQSVPAARSTPAASVAARSRAPALGPVEGSSFQLPVEFAAPRMGGPFSMMSPGVDPSMFCGEIHDPWRVWARAEYLLWWVEGMSTPPLITSSRHYIIR